MDTDTIKRAEEVFQGAVELPPAERGRYLDDRCARSGSFRAFVDRLLENHVRGMGGFLEEPVVATTIPDPETVVTVFPARIGPYEIVRVLGEGGMGVVYEARQEQPRRTVALKVIRPGLASREMLKRFRREADLLGQLQHPGIACIYEAGTATVEVHGATVQRPFFAMELVKGRPLTEHAREENLDVVARLEIFARICDAAHHAHERGVVHRDLKPANVLVDESGQPKILDFGVARALEADVYATSLRTDAGQLIGTLSYMSPEQVGRTTQPVDARSDVYSLGVMLYQLLSSRTPLDLDHRSIADAVRTIQEVEPAHVGTIDTRLRGDIDTIVTKAIEKDPDRRYQSAALLAKDLRRYLRNEPIVARRPSRIYRVRKFSTRHKGLVGGLCTTFLVLVLGVVGTTSAMLNALAASRRSNAIDEFLHETLAAADPMRGSRRDITVREVMDAAAEKIDAGSLTDQPGVEAAVRATLGNTYQQLGLYPKAQRQYETSIVKAREAADEETIELAATINGLGQVLLLQGRLNQSEQRLREAMDLRVRLVGRLHKLTAISMNDLAVVKQRQGAYDEAERLHREVLQIRRDLLGDQDEDVAVSLNNLAILLRIRGAYGEAERCYREALEIRRKVHGDRHVLTASSIHNLAVLDHYQSDLEAAEPLYREALSIRKEVLGDKHPAVASTLSSLAGVLQGRGDLEQARVMFEEALLIRRETLGPHSPKVATTLHNLGGVLRKLDRYAEAESNYREALEILNEALPRNHPDILFQTTTLAGVIREQGRYQEAEVLFRQVAEQMRTTRPADDWRIAEADADLGKCLAQVGQFPEAESLLLRAHGILDSLSQDVSQPAALKRCTESLVELYGRWDRPEDAQRWLTDPQDTEDDTEG